MFRPVPLVLVNIQVREEDISRTTAILTRLRIMHLLNLLDTPLGKLGYLEQLDRELLERYQRLGQEIDRLAQALEIPPQMVEIPPDLDPAKDIYRLEEAVEQAQTRIGSVLHDLQKNTERLTALTRYQDNLQWLRPAEIDLTALADLRFTYIVAGLLPTENIPKLEQALEHQHHALIPVSTTDTRTVMLAATLAPERDTLDRALKGAFFEILELPPTVTGTIEEALAVIQAQIRDLEEAQQQLQTTRAELRAELGAELTRIRNRLDLTRTLLRARVLFGKVGRTFLISGWIPAQLVERLQETLTQEIGDQALVEVITPEAVPGVRAGILKIPILFNNPYLLRPFERLTTAYGTPSYREIEPTAFLAVGFLLMFGLMFGDVGHGLVLFGIGYLIFRKFFRYLDYGIILMECGVAAMIFGLLYGSVFGVEDLLPVLWFRPMQDINYFMKMAIIFGVVIVSLGLILSFINAIRLRQARLPGGGLLAALFYWILAGLGLRYLVTGALVWDFWVALGVSLVTLGVGALFIFQRLWLAPPAPETPTEGRGLRVVEGLIEVVDGTVRYVANTISFIRIAAFALAHAGLFIAVFSLAETLGQLPGGGLLYWVTIVLGNVVIILLEGLVVSIQTIRLEYYEFLSKFFHGGGEPFKPLERGAIP